MSVARFTAKKLSQEQIAGLINCVVSDFSSLKGLRKIILFGSAANGTMTEASDLDVIFILDSVENTDSARKTVHTLRQQARWPMDMLFVDEATYSEKSEIGGVFFIARVEGRIIYDTSK